MALDYSKYIENITLTAAQWNDAKTKYEGVCAEGKIHHDRQNQGMGQGRSRSIYGRHAQ